MLGVVVLIVVLMSASSGTAETNQPTSEQCKRAKGVIAYTSLHLIIAEAKGAKYDYKNNKEAIDFLDAQEVETIKGLDNAPAFQQAMKDFTITSREYLNNIAAQPGESQLIYSARTSALKTKLDQATNRVNLEAKLACPG